MNDVYKTILQSSTGYYKDKGSKFHSFAYPVENEHEVKKILQSLKKEHHSARHHCYAWRIGTEQIAFRANDDGEPSSTAGKPILGQLVSFDVTNILVVVVRYFGGTLLGVSGLINAYKLAAAEALKNAEIVTNCIEVKFQLDFTYAELNQVMQIIKNENLTVLNSQFEVKCRLLFSVRKSAAKRIQQRFNQFYGVEIKSI
jgi:uncharacterized YigZ family protein